MSKSQTAEARSSRGIPAIRRPRREKQAHAIGGNCHQLDARARLARVDHMQGNDVKALGRQCRRSGYLVLGRFVQVRDGLQMLNMLVAIRPPYGDGVPCCERVEAIPGGVGDEGHDPVCDAVRQSCHRAPQNVPSAFEAPIRGSRLCTPPTEWLMSCTRLPNQPSFSW